jgi:phosphate starvation-inducible protein PhoH
LDAVERLHGIDGLTHLSLTNADIVRNPLVHKIVQAYEKGGRKRR